MESNCGIPQRGRIVLVIGPMCAGKTSDLLRRARRHRVGKKRVLIVNPKCNNRGDALKVSTHNKDSEDAVVVERLSEVWLKQDDFDVFAVDEGQFVPDLVDECDRLANAGKVVIVSGLSGDYKRAPFPTIAELIPRADEVHFLKAVCTVCGEEAPFSKLLNSEGMGADSVKIGGLETYEPRCRECWN